MNRSILPDDEKDVDRTAWAISIAVFAAVAAALCGASFLLTRIFDDETSDLIVGIPGFFAVLILSPAHERAKRYLVERRCIQSGGHYLVPIVPGSEHAKCGSCGRIVADVFNQA
jgi:hypothetical protein